MLEAKARIDGAGIGCEPASAATLAGVRKLRAEGVVREDERVVCVLTGHVLKDPDVILAQKERIAARLIEIDAHAGRGAGGAGWLECAGRQPEPVVEPDGGRGDEQRSHQARLRSVITAGKPGRPMEDRSEERALECAPARGGSPRPHRMVPQARKV